ncbi:MAG: hypothetical protein ACK4JE_06025 [Endomicrobiia bacterium]
MKKLVYFFAIATVISFFSTGVFTAEHPEHPTKTESKKIEAVTTATPKPQEGQLVITGTVLCTSCELKKKGAKSQCSVYGCSYSVKTKNVRSPKGQLVKDYVGKTYQILTNDSSSALLQKEYKGKDVIIVGKIYPEENVLEVDFVKLAPEKKSEEKPATQKKEHSSEHPTEHPK